MSFSLPRFLRRTQSSDLQRYFSARDIPFSAPIDWTVKPAALLDSVKKAIEALPERAPEQVFEDFERVDQLSDEADSAHCSPSSNRMKRCSVSFIPVTAGLFVLLTDEEAFDHALATAYAEECAMVAAGVDIASRLLWPRAKTPPISPCSKVISARYSINSTVPVGS